MLKPGDIVRPINPNSCNVTRSPVTIKLVMGSKLTIEECDACMYDIFDVVLLHAAPTQVPPISLPNVGTVGTYTIPVPGIYHTSGAILKEFYGGNRSELFEKSPVSMLRKCECGSHSVGVDMHSDYCPLYTKS